MSSAVVVGAGVFGAATARELALRGWDVTLVEQYAPGTVRSASGGDTPNPIKDAQAAAGVATFTKAGTFGFLCGNHPSMTGAIKVIE